MQGQTELELLSSNDRTILNFLTNNETIKVRVIGPGKNTWRHI